MTGDHFADQKLDGTVDILALIFLVFIENSIRGLAFGELG